MRRFTRRSLLRTLLLVGILLLPGTPQVLAQEEASAALQLATLETAADARLDVGDEQGRTGAPPDVDELRRLQQTLTLSGTNPPYPRNHVLDGQLEATGNPPSNHDFETAGYSVGTAPSNADLEAAPELVGTPPTNHDFETGDLSGWTTANSVTIQNDLPHGSYATLSGSNAEAVSAAFTVESEAQVFAVDLGWLSTSGYSWVKISVLSGSGYTTATEIASLYCSSCGTWSRHTFDASAWQGQSIKLKFWRYLGNVGIDDVQVEALFPDYTLDGPVRRVTENSDTIAYLRGNGVMTTDAFTVESGAQYGTVQAKKSGATAFYFYVYALSGIDYSTETQVFYGSTTTAGWDEIQFNLAAFAGQSIKLKFRQYGGAYGYLDDLGLQKVIVADWAVTEDTRREVEQGNHFVSTNGRLTSQPFTLPADIQQLLIPYRDASGDGVFFITLLGGLNYSEELVTARVTGIDGGWQTHKVGVEDFAGQTVKLVLEQHWGRLHFDDLGSGEAVIPGWTLVGSNPIMAGEDSQGSYITPIDQYIDLQSSPISTGIVDRTGYTEQRYYAVTYAFNDPAGGYMRVTWVSPGVGSWVVFDDAASTAAEPRTNYFWLADFMGAEGYFVVRLPKGGRFYSLADNIARQQLNEPFSEQVGYNIDTSTGNFGYQVRDLATEGLMPLQFVRHYTGHSDHYGVMGYRWTHSYDTRLVVLANDDAGVTFGSGREIFFDWYTYVGDPPNRYIAADPRNHESLVKNGDGTYTLTTTTNLDYHFDAHGVLLTISDLNGNTVTLNRDGQGRVTTVTNTAGRTITLTYDGNGHLATATDPVGAVVTYGYDANGDLKTVTDAENKVWTYSYDRHRLISVTAPDSTVQFTNTLDDWHRVTTQTMADGATIHLTYDTPGKGATQVTDPENNTATYYFDAFQRTTNKVDPLGNIETTEYDAAGNLQKRINPAGEEWTFAYDNVGNRTSEIDPLGNPTSYTFNPLRQPLTVTDARGKVWTNVYDSLGNLTTTTDPDNHTTTYTYNANGNVTSVTDALNQTTSYTYDGAGNRTSMTDARNKTWQWTYDAAGRMLTETNPLNETTTYTRNLFGWITKIKDPLGHEYSFTYDIWGNLVTHTDPLGNVTTWGYDERADVVSKTDPLEKVTTYAYDDNHNMISMTDPLNRTTSWTYDDLNRLTSTTDPLNQTTSYTYDDADRLATLTDPLNRTTTFAYDDAGRLTSRTLPSGGIWGWTYDPNGNVLTETNPRNYTTAFAYDDVNRLTSMTDALSGVVSFGYDAVGNRTSLTDPRNNTWSSTFDAVGNVLTETDPLNRTITWTYDDAGRRATQTDQRSIQIAYGYDAAGNLTSVTAPTETVTYTYDAADRLTSMTDGTGTTTWGLDELSQVTSVAAPQDAVNYTYDDAGQRTSMMLPGNRTISYGYDVAGNLTSLTDWQSRVVGFTYNAANQRSSITRPNGVTTTYGYDTGGRLNSIVHADGGTTLESYSYTLDAMGNRTAVTTLSGTESYVLDALNRLTSVTYTNGDVVGYTYDAAGNRLTQVVNGVTTNSYTYDSAGQMTSDGVTTYTYDAAGNLLTGGTGSYTWDWKGRLASATIGGTTVSYAYDGLDVRTSGTVGGVTTAYMWDRADGLPMLVDDGTNGYLHADGLIAEITGSGVPTYHLTDALGSVRGLTDLMGASIGTSDFDVFGDIRTQTGATSIFAFTGEQRETVTGMTYLRARYYEPGYGRFLSADTVQPGGPGTQGYNRYVYVGNNPCTTTDPSGHSTAFESYDGCVRVIRLVVAQMVQETLAYLNLSPLLTTTAAEYVQRMGGLLFLLFFFIRVCLELATRPDSGAGQGNPNSPSSPPALRSSPDGYPALPSSAT